MHAEGRDANMILKEMIDLCKEEMIKAGKGACFTGEKNILMTYEQLHERLKDLDYEYPKTLEIELNVFQNNRLIITSGENIIIPDWDFLITQIDSFTIVRNTPHQED